MTARADFESKLERLAPTVCGGGAFVCGCWCPRGWEKLVEDLVVEVEKLAVAQNLSLLRIDQIKEKFGGLRVYFNRVESEEIRNLVSSAEARSFSICDQCGEPGKPSKGGWVSTRCEKHEKGST